MTRGSYRLVETFLHFYTLHIHSSLLILHSHHTNPYSLIRSCLCLLSHITQKSHGFFLYFSLFQLVSFYYIIFMHAILPFYHSSPSYSLFSISVALKQHTFLFFSTCPHLQQSSSYLHAIHLLPLTGRYHWKP